MGIWRSQKAEEQPSPVQPSRPQRASGPDEPKTALADDRLRRVPLARGIVELVCQAPADTSLRIGVHGRAGEGRTTFLRFVEELALERSCLVAWLDPSSLARPEDLGDAFLADVLARLDPDLASAKRHVRTAAEVRAAYASARQPLAGKRIVVLVDDVDRVRPDVLPVLLMGIRERLSLPGCHFVLALDPELASRGLASAHPGWPEVRALAEKVLDYEFRLPAFSAEDRRLLVAAELARLGAGLDPATLIAGCHALVPTGSRKLKRLLRGLGRLAPALERHDPQDLHASPLLWLELLRATAPAAAERVLASEELIRQLQQGASAPRRKREALEKLAQLFPKEDSEPLRPRTDTAGSRGAAEEKDIVVPGRSDRAEFLRVAESLLDRGPAPTLPYWAGIARGEMPAVSLSEVRRLLARACTAGEMDEWLAERAAGPGTSAREAQQALLALLVAIHEEALVRAVEGELEEDLELCLSELQAVRACLRWLVVDRGAFQDALASRKTFRLLLEHLARWAHLTRHPGHRAARESEREILFAIAGDLGPLAVEILDDLGAQDPGRQAETAEGAALIGQVCDLLKEGVVPRIVTRFLEADGLSSMGPSERYLMFGPSSALYMEHGRAAFAEACEVAASNPAVQRNLLAFLRMLHAATRGGLDGVPREDAERLAADRTLVRLAWGAATCRRVQPKHRQKLRQVREGLGRLGSLEDLPAPEWLDEMQ